VFDFVRRALFPEHYRASSLRNMMRRLEEVEANNDRLLRYYGSILRNKDRITERLAREQLADRAGGIGLDPAIAEDLLKDQDNPLIKTALSFAISNPQLVMPLIQNLIAKNPAMAQQAQQIMQQAPQQANNLPEKHLPKQ
jgi:hypothetical protein